MPSEELQPITVRLDRPLWERLRRFAFERRIRQAEVVREALRQYLDAQEDAGEGGKEAGPR